MSHEQKADTTEATIEAEPARTVDRPQRAQRGWVREIVETLLLTSLIFLGVRGVVQSFRVEGNSMTPTLHSEELLLVNKAVYWHTDSDSAISFLAQGDAGRNSDRYLFHAPEFGEVVVFEAPQDQASDYIKRVIGVPGDTIEILDGSVWRNGKRIEEPYTGGTLTEVYQGESRWEIPPDYLFVLGDNRLGSSDSRSWGLVPIDNVVGKAMFTYWPVSEWGVVLSTISLAHVLPSR